MLQSIWGWKVELALRTGFAAFMAAIYAMSPQVHAAKWNNATVFAPVLAIACLSGPNIGATVHHALEMWVGTFVGCLTSMLVNECVRLVPHHTQRQALALLLFLLAVFFLCSRPWELGQKRVSVGVMLCGTVNMVVKSFALPWWYPWTVGTPCTVGLILAVIATLLPWPHSAISELRKRVALQAALHRSIMAEQFEAFVHKKVASAFIADRTLGTAQENCSKMNSLLKAASFEVWHSFAGVARLQDMVNFFAEQLKALHALDNALSDSQGRNDSALTSSHVTFQSFIDEPWRSFLSAIAAQVDDMVIAEHEQRPVDPKMVEAVQVARAAFNTSVEQARREILYKGGSLYDPEMQSEAHGIQHCQRMAVYFLTDHLAEVTVGDLQMCERISHKSHPRFQPAKVQGLWSWLGCPTGDASKEALKKTICMGLLSIIAWVPELRQQHPQFIWAFIAASFVFSNFEGSSISTGLGRVVGTLLGGISGLIVMEWLDTIKLTPSLYLASHVLVCVTWTTLCALGRAHPRYGYVATVASFSIYIMVVGKLENFHAADPDSVLAQKIVLHRTKMQFVGAATYVAVEVLLWPKSARAQATELQEQIMRTLRSSMAQALESYTVHAQGEIASSIDSDSCSDVSDEDSCAGSTHLAAPKLCEAGLALIAKGKAALSAAADEPPLWLKAFPVADLERMLDLEQTFFYLISALDLAARHASAGEVDEEVVRLIADYATKADEALKASLQRMAEIGAQVGGDRRLRFDLSKAIGFETSEDIESWDESLSMGPLRLLHKADRQLRAGVQDRIKSFDHHVPTCSNQVSFAVNTLFFNCLKFTSMMEEGAKYIRTVLYMERARIHV